MGLFMDSFLQGGNRLKWGQSAPFQGGLHVGHLGAMCFYL